MSATESMRVSDAERERVAARLSAAHVEGRLTLVEYDERVRAAHGAVVRDDLAPLTADLPEPASERPVRPVGPEAEPRRPGRRGPVPFAPPFPFPGAGGRGGPLPAACGPAGAGSVAAWAVASVVNVVIWVAVVLGSGTLVHPWWIWVAGPWGLVLAAGALSRRRPARGGELRGGATG